MIRDEPASARRPIAVTVAAAFLFLATVISSVTAESLLFPSPWWNWLWDLNRAAYVSFARLGPAAGFLLLAVGAVAAAAGTGLIRRRRWAWWIAISLFTINGLGDAFTLFVKQDLAKGVSGMLIAGAFLFWLSRPAAMRYFREARSD